MEYKEPTKIDLSKTFKFFTRDDYWKTLIGKWSLIALAVLFLIIGSYGVMFVPAIFAEAGFMDDSGVIFLGLFCCGYILVMGIIFGVTAYAKGASINNYRKMREKRNIDDLSIADFEPGAIGKNIVDGLKMLFVNFIYFLPYVIVVILWVVVFSFIMIAAFEGDSARIEQIGVIFMILYVVSLMLLVGFQFLYMYFVSCVLKPIIYEVIYREGFMAALRISKVLSIFRQNAKPYLMNSVFILLPYLLWFALYMLSGILVYLCVGVLLIPVVYGLYYIIQIYVDPHMITQAMKIDNK